MRKPEKAAPQQPNTSAWVDAVHEKLLSGDLSGAIAAMKAWPEPSVSACERIIECTGLPLRKGKLPSQLWSDLEGALSWRETSRALGVRSPLATRAQRATQIENVAKRLLQLIERDRDDDGMFLAHHTANSTADPAEALRAIITAALTAKAECQGILKANSALRQHLGNVSPFEYLAGRRLAAIYETYFGKQAKVSKPPDGSDPGGPFVRFAEQALIELNVRKPDGSRYSRHAIVAALKKAGRGKSRRRESAAVK